MPNTQIILADYTWTGHSFEPDVRVYVDATGRIQDVRTSSDDPTVRLHRRALLPGFINAHSHAFQRGLRGRGEQFPSNTGSFWTWREAMYALVSSLDEKGFYDLCVMAFEEMLHAGITTVGEFHYLHHSPKAMDHHFDDILLAAAADAGIRLVLISTFYRFAGVDQTPLGTAQQRFSTPDAKTFCEHLDTLSAKLQNHQTLGIAAHSVRAASLEDIAVVHHEAQHRDMCFHIHVEEQRREIDECIAVHHRRPMTLLLDTIDVGGNTTAVHCTHTTAEDLRAFTAAGGSVCYCPTTEANLGDGIPVIADSQTPGTYSLGTDSNLRIGMTEEMRWLEYGQRLRSEKRGILKSPSGSVALPLFQAGTAGGATSLRIPAGSIESGRWADFLTLDLDHPTLRTTTPNTLLDSLVFGADNESIRDVCVGGRWVVTDKNR